MSSRGLIESKLSKLHARIVAEKDIETQSLLLKYFCLQTSGYLEICLKNMVLNLSQGTSPKSVANLVQHHLKNLTNLSFEKIEKLLEVLNPNWAKGWRENVEDRIRLSINSLLGNRNSIAHGLDVGLSLRQMEQYYFDVLDAVKILNSIVKK